MGPVLRSSKISRITPSGATSQPPTPMPTPAPPGTQTGTLPKRGWLLRAICPGAFTLTATDELSVTTPMALVPTTPHVTMEAATSNVRRGASHDHPHTTGTFDSAHACAIHPCNGTVTIAGARAFHGGTDIRSARRQLQCPGTTMAAPDPIYREALEDPEALILQAEALTHIPDALRTRYVAENWLHVHMVEVIRRLLVARVSPTAIIQVQCQPHLAQAGGRFSHKRATQ